MCVFVCVHVCVCVYAFIYTVLAYGMLAAGFDEVDMCVCVCVCVGGWESVRVGL